MANPYQTPPKPSAASKQAHQKATTVAKPDKEVASRKMPTVTKRGRAK